MVLGLTALRSQSFLTFLNKFYPALFSLLWHSYYSIIKNTEKKSSQLLLLHSLWNLSSYFTNHSEIFGLLGSLDVSLDDERYYIQYMIAKRTKSEAHSTASYNMEADTKDKMWLSNLHTLCSLLLTTALGNSGSCKKLIFLMWLRRVTTLKKTPDEWSTGNHQWKYELR